MPFFVLIIHPSISLIYKQSLSPAAASLRLAESLNFLGDRGVDYFEYLDYQFCDSALLFVVSLVNTVNIVHVDVGLS